MELGYPLVISTTICFLFLLHHLNGSRSKTLPTNWLFVGMLPSLLLNLHRIQDWLTHFLSKNGCTFLLRGPWFTNMTNYLVTSDPANMRHVFNTNFSNYIKGSHFRENFDVLGDGLFNADAEAWKAQRREWHQLIMEKQFQRFYQQSSYSKVRDGLVPVLEHVLKNQNMVVDLQDLFKRFTFDATVMALSGTDPGSLAGQLERNQCIEAFEDVEEAILYRHVMPVSWWKLQRWLRTGRERKLSEAKQCLDQFVARCISAKRDSKRMESVEKQVDLLASILEEGDEVSDKFLSDFMLNFMLAGTGTLVAGLTWFFWLVLQNPRVETAIIEELKRKISSTSPEGDNKFKIFQVEELKGLVYLHGALCEALRLFPPVPFELRRPVEQDTLPSGHRVNSETKIFLSIYAMARMEVVWGEDCSEFKPERWITDEGGVMHVPSHKFAPFLTGPRSCLGKEIAFAQMRMVAATLLYNYHVEVVEGEAISPKPSIIMYMSPGLKVRIKPRT